MNEPPHTLVGDELLAAWRATLADAWVYAQADARDDARGDVLADADRVGLDLLRRWREPHRRYHDVGHLAAVLTALEDLSSPAPPPAPLRLAAWFHDAVYAGRPGADEAASADLAAVVLPTLGVADAVVAEVVRLVRLTATHDPAPDDDAGALLVDADLAVLAAAPEGYRAYAGAVREEYAHVPEAAFRAGRAAVLRGLLDHPHLYHTAAGRHRWEAAARANLTAELVELTDLPG